MHDGRLNDKRAAADALCVSVRTIERLVASGELRPVRIGRRVLFADDELRRFMCNAMRSVHLAPAVPLPWRAERRK